MTLTPETKLGPYEVGAPQITPNRHNSRENGITLPDLRTSLKTRRDVPKSDLVRLTYWT